MAGVPFGFALKPPTGSLKDSEVWEGAPPKVKGVPQKFTVRVAQFSPPRFFLTEPALIERPGTGSFKRCSKKPRRPSPAQPLGLSDQTNVDIRNLLWHALVSIFTNSYMC